MPSIPPVDPAARPVARGAGIAPILLALLAPAVALLSCQLLAPPSPRGPRYVGAGHQEPRRGGVLRVHHESDLRSLDPAFGFDEISGVAIRLLFDPLLGYDAGGRLVPALLRELPEPLDGGRRFRLTLAPGRRFHDGSRVDAEDVRFTLDRLRDPETRSPAAGFFSQVASVDVIDEHRLDVVLIEPDHTFPWVLAMDVARPVPREAYTDGTDRRFRPVGSGPYRLARFERDLRVEMVPFDGHPSPPYPDRVVYELNLPREPAFLRFRNGELEHSHRQSKADYLLLRRSPGWEPTHVVHEAGEIWGLEMNCEMPPFDDVHVRRAVAFAIDRERFARTRNHLVGPLGLPLPKHMIGPDVPMDHRQHLDVDQARREMALAGRPDGLPDPVDLMVGQGEVAKAYGELVQADLATIGIEVQVKQTAFSTYLDQIRRRGTVPFFLGGWIPDYPHPSTFLDSQFHSKSIADVGSNNKSFYSNPAVDRLLDRARAIPDPERQMTLYREAADLIAADAPWAFVFETRRSHVWQPYLRGYRPHPVYTLDYRGVWLDLPRRRATPAPAPRTAGWLGPLLGTRSLASVAGGLRR